MLICQKIVGVQIRNTPSVNPLDIYRPGSSQPCLQPEQQRPFFPSQLHQNRGARVLSKVLKWRTLGQGWAVLHGAVGPAVMLEHTRLFQTLAECLLSCPHSGSSRGLAMVWFHHNEHPFGATNVLGQVEVLLGALRSLESWNDGCLYSFRLNSFSGFFI